MNKELILLIAKVVVACVLVVTVAVMAILGIAVPETLKLITMAAIGYLYHQRSGKTATQAGTSEKNKLSGKDKLSQPAVKGKG